MQKKVRRIGLDFDNTIACYDTAFCEVAIAQGLIAEGSDLSKSQVKNQLHLADEARKWTQLQGLVYGPEIHRAKPFPGVGEFITGARSKGWEVVVVSHKTPVPVIGERWDLHSAAMNWLSEQGFFDLGLDRENVYFEPTRETKIRRLTNLACQIFVDDLPEVFLEETFPANVERWLHGHQEGPWRRFQDWTLALTWLSKNP